MNDTLHLSEVDLVRYVGDVRAQLADLPAEVVEELTEGLAADLAELVEERGSEALSSPEEYAAELRAAAGLGQRAGRPRREWGLSRAAMDAMDAAHVHWDRLLDAFPGDVRGFITVLQPVWWVVRAWVAWMVAQDVTGATVGFADGSWLIALGVCVVVSVQLGRRAWGVARLLRASVLARLALVVLNVFAVAMLPGAADRAAYRIAEDRAWVYVNDVVPAYNESVVTYEGRQACVLHVFDADGERVKGGYVWDASGQRKLPMNNRSC
ncbi:hypothetical protein [Nocardioides sp. SR21]|uniref:hypothetical protein n=1 Tax=Nocardioides sp. SR21 TaxID=2919501 RepID=UPI001FAB3289|nr:hypothetical protein [Nocardioides sp. SR21]